VRSTGEKKGVLARIRMTARLKLHLGDQKIDVIGDHEDSPVVQEALKNGIQLI
ncbi:nucleotidyltransferase domain-containing protein, partial [Escherichia coli]|nr:nucleotidyltransferase domain-containing protein [Escherichia coli]